MMGGYQLPYTMGMVTFPGVEEYRKNLAACF